jgi:hypothetical protein
MHLSTIFTELNWAAVAAAAIAHMITGLLWFQRPLFGAAWARLTGAEPKPATQWLPAGVAGHLLIAVALAVVIRLANATTALEGFAVAVLVWAGFVVTLEIGELIWEKIPFPLFLIRAGNHFLALGLAGIILAVWR